MKKLFTFFFALLLTLSAMAQNMTVQGVRRNVQARTQDIPTVTATVDFDSIRYWVGSGINKAALIVKWSDGKGGDTNLVWGYKWKGTATGEQMLNAIAAADPRFYMLVKSDTPYGTAIGGIGFDLDGDGISYILKDSTTKCSLANGIYTTTAYYDFDSYTSPNAADHWQAGWYQGYWSYWVADGTGKDFSYSQLGASSRQLTNKCVDGWSFISDMENWYSNDMSGTLEYVSKPASTTSASKVMKAEDASETAGSKYTVKDWDEMLAAYELAQDGDTISFAPERKDSVYQASDVYSEKDLVFLGNGINLKDALFYVGEGKSGIFKDFTLTDISTYAFYGDNASMTLENCILSGGTITSESAIRTEHLSGDENACAININSCLFKDLDVTGSDNTALIEIASNNAASADQAQVIYGNLNNNTFLNNNVEGEQRGLLCAINYAHVKMFGNVMSGNTCEAGLSLINRTKEDGDLVSLGYNVIDGQLNENVDTLFGATDVIADSLGIIYQENENGELAVVEDTKAYQNIPANPTVENLAEKDVYGNAIDYTQPTNSGASQLTVLAPVDYTKGVFIVNEDWYGHQNSTMNFITDEGKLVYRVIQRENPGKTLGCTAQHGQIYGDKFLIMSKQEKDGGDKTVGGRLTICDAKTLKILKQYEEIPIVGGDGRAVCGVDENKAYVGTTGGVAILDLNTLEINRKVEGVYTNSLYTGQIGTMVRRGDYVFAVQQDAGIFVIDANTDTCIDTLTIDTLNVGKGWGFGSIVLSKDGNLWASAAATSGSGYAYNGIIKIDPFTFEMKLIETPDTVYGPANSWYAWTPDGFCASKQHNVLYWNGGSSSWFANKAIYKYDIDKNEFTPFIDLNSESWKIYGCSFRVDPVSDDAIVSLYKEFASTEYTIRRYDNKGNIKAEYPMEKNYWFPSLPVFPDNEAPTATVDDQATPADVAVAIALNSVVDDADNMNSGIIVTVDSISDTSILTAKVVADSLVITPAAEGTATVTLKVNSNGHVITTDFTVTVTTATAINTAKTDEAGNAKVEAIYNVSGAVQGRMVKGINIVRMSDGKVKKVLVK